MDSARGAALALLGAEEGAPNARPVQTAVGAKVADQEARGSRCHPSDESLSLAPARPLRGGALLGLQRGTGCTPQEGDTRSLKGLALQRVAHHRGNRK